MSRRSKKHPPKNLFSELQNILDLPPDQAKFAAMEQELKNISPRLRLRISKRARRIALRLDNKSRVMHLVVPPRIQLKKAFAFAEQHKKWIRQKISELPKPVKFEDGAIIPLFGHEVEIKVFYDKTLRRTDFILNRHELLVLTNKHDPADRIMRYLREQARKEISALVEEKSRMIGRKVKSLHIRDTSSRWGSCGTGGKLSFSWRLVFAPRYAMDYVVAHEVAHITHMNHGPRFWALCEDLSDNYKRGKDWMRDHAHNLLRYGQKPM